MFDVEFERKGTQKKMKNNNNKKYQVEREMFVLAERKNVEKRIYDVEVIE